MPTAVKKPDPTRTNSTVTIVGPISIDLVVEEKMTLDHLRKQCPSFFTSPSGARETYRMHRGFVIVRFTRPDRLRRRPQRLTSIYLCHNTDQSGTDTYLMQTGCLSNQQAMKYIDKVLRTGCHTV